MKIYFDPSCLIALYLPEAASPRLRAFLGSHGQPLLVNSLQELEFRNAARQKVLRRDISATDLARCLAVFERDWVEGRIVRKTVAWEEVFPKAEAISRRLGLRQECRTFDLLHVAISAASGVRQFATLDSGQAEIARRAGLKPVEFPEA